jgi:protein-disulfide isomerase
MRILASLGLVAVLALSSSACGKTASTASDEHVRAYLLEHPEVIEEAMQKLQQKRQAAADTELKKALVANRSKMERDGRDFVAGNPQGAVTVVEFFDYRCPYCKVAMPGIQKMLADNKDVRFVVKELPILSPISEVAARAALGAKAQGKYWPVHQALMAEKNLDEAAIERILRDNGVDVARARADGGGQAASDLLDETRNLARATGVTGTPAFFVHDRLVAGWQPDRIQEGIEAARKAS